MTKYFTNTFSLINLFKKPSVKSEIVTQMLYGESFSVSKKLKKWLSIKIKEDNYRGFIRNKNFSEYLKPTHKVNSLKVSIYKLPGSKKKNLMLPFGSKIKVIKRKLNYYQFEKGWVKKEFLSPISYKDKDPFKQKMIFKNIKYKWGGKSFKGIDCSGLIQILLNFNNRFCPRDAKDQVKFFKKNIRIENLKKNDLIFWKGHVALAISKRQLIHAYGPKKKTLIMNVDETIKRIKRTANLSVTEIKRV